MEMNKGGLESSADELMQQAQTTGGNLAMGLVFGAAAAIAGAAVWAGVTIVTHYEIGWLAWGIGVLVGFACVLGAKKPSVKLGATSASLAILSLVIAKLFVFQWAAPAEFSKEILNDPHMLRAAATFHLMEAGRFPEALRTKMQQPPADANATQALDLEVNQFTDEALGKMSDGEKEQVAKAFADKILSNISTQDRLMDMLSFWDILWAGLAVASAWGIASGGNAAKV